MVDVTENWPSNDARFRLDRPSRWGIHGQGKVGSEIVIVGDVLSEDAPEMRFAERDDMVDALATD